MEHSTVQPPPTESALRTVHYTGSDGRPITGKVVDLSDFVIVLAVDGTEVVDCWLGGKFSLFTTHTAA